jgi:hypothetical protein
VAFGEPGFLERRAAHEAPEASHALRTTSAASSATKGTKTQENGQPSTGVPSRPMKRT